MNGHLYMLVKDYKMIKAVKKNGCLLEFASSKLKHDVVLKAVQQNGISLEFASE